MQTKRYFNYLLLTLTYMSVWCFSTLSFAGIVLGGTRVIYPADQNEVTVNMRNAGTLPVLAQSWIDNGNQSQTPDKIPSPFVITPPINRIDAGKGQTLRISLINKQSIPENKESVFYLNVLEIPSKDKNLSDTNHISIAFRTRIKIFYRPTSLTGSANEAPELLQWELVNGGVKAINPTPFYITLGKVTYTNVGKKYETDGNMIAPGSTSDFHFSNVNDINDTSNISFSSINDYGAVVSHKLSK